VTTEAEDLARMIQMDRILEVVQAEFGVTRAQILAPTRSSPDVAWARQVAVHLCHALMPGVSWSDLGQMFGRDRTTVRHANQKVQEWRDLEDLDDWLEDMEFVCATPTV